MSPICEIKIDGCIIIRYWGEGGLLSIRLLSGKGYFQPLKALLPLVRIKVLNCPRYVNFRLMDVSLSDIGGKRIFHALKSSFTIGQD